MESVEGTWLEGFLFQLAQREQMQQLQLWPLLLYHTPELNPSFSVSDVAGRPPSLPSPHLTVLGFCFQ